MRRYEGCARREIRFPRPSNNHDHDFPRSIGNSFTKNFFSSPDTPRKHHEPTGRFFAACELRPYPSHRFIEHRQPISRGAPEACSDNFRCLHAGWVLLYQGMRIRNMTTYVSLDISGFKYSSFSRTFRITASHRSW